LPGGRRPPVRGRPASITTVKENRGAMEPKVKDFESALQSLEDIVARLEAGDLPLDRALELFEEGVKLSRYCSSKLDEAERKVEILVKDTDGGMTPAPFGEPPEA
jgi:exodeoxyribonuclease VII small subunit